MPSRPDLRDIATNVKEAFADADRDTLLDVLTFVIKEYVVEGPPPMMIHQAETLADLKGASFAQVISALQTRFDFAELAMFVVDGEHVGVRIGGVVQPLLPGRQPAATELPRPSAGVRVVEAAVQPRPAPAPAASAPPPTRGLSVREAAPASAQPAPPSAQPAQPAQPTTQPTQGNDKPEGSGDDAATRFGLLELD
ncbi:MAG: hypothetical protein ACKV2T_05440 [Kofleriaceae bacterium]